MVGSSKCLIICLNCFLVKYLQWKWKNNSNGIHFTKCCLECLDIILDENFFNDQDIIIYKFMDFFSFSPPHQLTFIRRRRQTFFPMDQTTIRNGILIAIKVDKVIFYLAIASAIIIINIFSVFSTSDDLYKPCLRICFIIMFVPLST